MKALALILLLSTTTQPEVKVGAKHFTEGYILSEIISQILESRGVPVKRVYNLGGTLVCFQALKNGEIDVYPEYTGTISREILKNEGDLSIEQMNGILMAKYGLAVGNSFGFNNTYALVVTSKTAISYDLKSISDLKKFPNLSMGLSYEFLKRQDGWDKLAGTYSLTHKPSGLEHGLAYQALLRGDIAVTDAYSTDAEISTNKLSVLDDDLHFFPAYEAVPLSNINLKHDIRVSITEAEMSAMNSLAVNNNMPFDQIARNFLVEKGLIQQDKASSDNTSNFDGLTSKILQHLYLTFTALILAIIFAVPLAVILYWNPKIANIILYIAGLLQTIPSIALLAIMIPLLGIGALPAIVALFLYALLPILRNTVNGLRNIDPLLKEIAASLGMSRKQALRHVEFPLALPAILTGIRIAAVINVGTATLAAFIGAGGLGEYIVTGLALNNTSMILTGAIPAAVLALAIELIFELIERKAIPAHLRKKN